MILEKINEILEGGLEVLTIENLTEVQQKTIARVKQGGDLLLTAGSNSGRSTAIAFSSILKAPESFEGSPRVLIFCSTVEKSRALFDLLRNMVRRTEITVEAADDKGAMLLQRNHIYDGVDIIVGNPKRIFELYLQNGIFLGKLRLVVIDDASETTKDIILTRQMIRMVDAMPKCQRIVLTSEMTSNLEKLNEVLLFNPLEVEVK
jgi:superfamily II DNA/RNA helicase